MGIRDGNQTIKGGKGEVLYFYRKENPVFHINAMKYEEAFRGIDFDTFSHDELKRVAELKYWVLRWTQDGGIHGYVPQYHVKGYQDDFHRSKKRYRWILGGNRSAKSLSGFCEDVWYSLGNHPYKQIRVPNHGWICSIDYSASRDIAEKEFMRLFPKSQIKKWNQTERILICKNGSTVGFKSYDSGFEKFQGRSMDWIHCDEQPPKQIYQECDMRLIDTGGHFWGTMTPTEGMSWVFDDVVEDLNDDTEIFYFDTRWNKYLPKVELDKMISKMSEDERRVRIEGKFIQLAGLIYKDFNVNVHVVSPFPIPDDWTKYRSIDHGLNNPTCCLWGAVNKEGELYIYDEYYETEKTVSENADAIKGISSGDKYEWTTIDPSTMNRDPLNKSSVYKEYRDCGIFCRALKHDRISGIGLVKEYLKVNEKTHRPRLFISNICRATIKEMLRYRWKSYRVGEDKNLSDEPQKVFDHAMDALRYMIASKPYYAAPEYEESFEFAAGGNPNWYL